MVIHLLTIDMSLRWSETLVAALCFCSYVLICPAFQRSAMSVAKKVLVSSAPAERHVNIYDKW